MARTLKNRLIEIHYYEWNVARWMTSETRDSLDATGRGIYRELLDACYAAKDFQNDPDWICRRCACTKEQLDAVWPKIARQFARGNHAENRLGNRFADIFRNEHFNYVQKQRANGKSSAVKSITINDINSGGVSGGVATGEAVGVTVGVTNVANVANVAKLTDLFILSEQPSRPLGESDVPQEPKPKREPNPKPESPEFLEFWEAYPKKEKRKQTATMYPKFVKEHAAVMAGLARFKSCSNWARGYILDPPTFLNGRRFDEYPDSVQSSPKADFAWIAKLKSPVIDRE